MNHLSPDELIDAVEGTLGAERQSHLTECAACGGQTARLRLILRDARAVAPPEPSPLFWDHFSARVRAAIGSEAAPTTRWVPGWARWPVLAPIAALAVLIVGIAAVMPRQPARPIERAVVASPDSALDLASIGEQEWALVSDIVGPLDLDVAHEAGIIGLGDAERAALGLSAAEQRELLRLLQQEMERTGS
jgi:hypothetical protein